MEKILAYGTFDIFHVGHLSFLQKAKNLGDYLIVGVTSNEFNRAKGKVTLFSYEERAKVVENIKFVDEIFKANSWDEKIKDVEKYKLDVVVASEEWRQQYEPLKRCCEVVFMSRYEGMSSTIIRDFLHRVDELMYLLRNFSISQREELVDFIEHELRHIAGK